MEEFLTNFVVVAVVNYEYVNFDAVVLREKLDTFVDDVRALDRNVQIHMFEPVIALNGSIVRGNYIKTLVK